MKSIIVFLKDVENIAEKYPRLQVRAKAVRWDLEKAMKVAQKKAKEAKPPATDNKQMDAISQIKDVLAKCYEALCTGDKEACEEAIKMVDDYSEKQHHL